MHARVDKTKYIKRMDATVSIQKQCFNTPTLPRSSCVLLGSILSLCFLFSPNLALAGNAATDTVDTFAATTAGPSFGANNKEARGVLKAGEEAIIASGMTARLLKAGYKPGQSFKRGALLAQFDCAQQDAELSAMTQAHGTLSLKYKNQDHLYQAGAAGELDVSVAKSEMQQAAAERDALKARLKHCRVYAPYAGMVVEKHVAAFETPAQNAPLYTVHRTGPLEISVIIPSKWLRWVRKDDAFTFIVDETGTELNGKISRIGAAVDPVSQTIEVTGKTTGSLGNTRSGMSGVAQFDTSSGT